MCQLTLSGLYIRFTWFLLLFLLFSFLLLFWFYQELSVLGHRKYVFPDKHISCFVLLFALSFSALIITSLFIWPCWLNEPIRACQWQADKRNMTPHQNLYFTLHMSILSLHLMEMEIFSHEFSSPSAVSMVKMKKWLDSGTLKAWLDYFLLSLPLTVSRGILKIALPKC